MIFDTHAHYDDEAFDEDRDQLLSSMKDGGVGCIVNVCASVGGFGGTLELMKAYPFVYGAVGVHPDDAGIMTQDTLDEIRRLSHMEKMVAIGEIGLDYYYDTHPKELQRFWFRQQLRLAEETNLPVIIHSRDASQETFDIIKASSVRRGSIHCYSGSAQMALDYVKMGFSIGVGGVVTFSNAKKLVETVAAIPMESILIETDCPYLAPNPNRGKRNDSTNLKYVVEKIAEIKNLPPETVAEISEKNAKSLFFK